MPVVQLLVSLANIVLSLCILYILQKQSKEQRPVAQGGQNDSAVMEALKRIEEKPLVAPIINIPAPVGASVPVAASAAAMPLSPVPSAAGLQINPYRQQAAVAPRKVPAKYTLGDVKLHTVPDKTAAMIMAIIADEMKMPLNELRFISIKEIT